MIDRNTITLKGMTDELLNELYRCAVSNSDTALQTAVRKEQSRRQRISDAVEAMPVDLAMIL